MGVPPTSSGDDPSFGRTTTPVSTDDLVRVVSRALSGGSRRIHLTAGQRRAILHAPLRPGVARA